MSLHKIKACSTIIHSYVLKMSQFTQTPDADQEARCRLLRAVENPVPQRELVLAGGAAQAEGFGHHALHGIRADIEACAFGVGNPLRSMTSPTVIKKQKGNHHSKDRGLFF